MAEAKLSSFLVKKPLLC